MSTIQDVANLAEVSLMTVSRVINGSDKVSIKTKEKVERAIKQLDYHPNMLAQGLASGSSRSLALIVPNLSDPYYGDVYPGVERAGLEEGYTVVYFSANNADTLQSVIEKVICRGFDGVAIYDLDPTDTQLKAITDAGMSCILLECEKVKDSDAFSSINLDYAAEARHVGEIFIKQGYKQVACVHGSTKPLTGNNNLAPRRQCQRRLWRERRDGFMAAFAGNKDIKVLDFEIDLAERPDSYLTGQQVAVSLKKYLDRQLAVYCSSDMIALGVKGYMLEHGIAMPSQIAIFGTDGLKQSITLYPRISTAVHPREKIGEMAVKQLIAVARDKKPNTHIILPTEEYFCGDTTYDF